MKWTRIVPGEYAAGPYLVNEVAEGWSVTGPGLVTREDCLWDTKAAAQAQAVRVAAARLDGDGARTAEPVVGDWTYSTGHYGQLSAILTGEGGQPLYCFKFPRGRRKCWFRYEFVLVTR